MKTPLVYFILAGLVFCSNPQTVSAQHGFWYPQSTFQYQSVQPILTQPTMPQSTIHATQPSFAQQPFTVVDPTYPTAPIYVEPFQPVAPSVIIGGEYESLPMESVTENYEIELGGDVFIESVPGETILDMPLVENSLNVENSSEIILDGEVAETGETSATDANIEDMQRQAQRDAAELMLKLDDKVNGMEESLNELRQRVESLAEPKIELEPADDKKESLDDQLDKVAAARKKLRTSMEKKLESQKRTIDAMATKIRELEESRAASREQATNADIVRLEADIKRALEALQSRPSDSGAVPNKQLRRQLDQIAEIVEREVQESIREERERIVRSVIRQATLEMEKAKTKTNDDEKERPRRGRRKHSDDDDDERLQN
jgi:hypothetical protein